MALGGLGSNPGLERAFRLDYASAHAMRLNSRTDTEGLPVSSLNCDKPLHSGKRAPETVMSTDGQITDTLGHMHRAGHCSTRTCYDLAVKVGRLWAAQGCQGIWAQRPRLEDTVFTVRQAVYCKHTVQGSPNRLTCAVQHITHTNTYLAYIIGACAMGRFDMASAMTVNCHTGLCFYDHRVQSIVIIVIMTNSLIQSTPVLVCY